MISETLDILCDLLNQTADHGYQIDRGHGLCRLRAAHGKVTEWMDSEQALSDWMGPYYQGLKAGVMRPAGHVQHGRTETAYLLAMAQDRADSERFA